MYPSYLNFGKKELEKRIEKLFESLESCEICPRKCHVRPLPTPALKQVCTLKGGKG
jgi:putative pyruvate formate lyase activating enzyme